ncbi:hypothetical protein JC200_04125 [Alicyclobacillus sp. ALC3]|nr:hypothetical protein JC200_04125 [Alicyclobacillus sp. ALC3]
MLKSFSIIFETPAQAALHKGVAEGFAVENEAFTWNVIGGFSQMADKDAAALVLPGWFQSCTGL